MMEPIYNESITFAGMEHRVKDYLHDVRRRVTDIDATRTEIEKERELIKAVKYSDNPKNPNAYGDAIPDSIIKVHEHIADLEQSVCEHIEIINHAYRLCRPYVSGNVYALWLHYIQEMPWDRCANAMRVSSATIYRMRADGIIELYASMPEEYRRDDEHKAQT